MKDNLYLLVALAMLGAALLVVSFILITIYNSNRLLRQKRKLQEAELKYQSEMLYAVIDSQEKERQRIGMDLHDEVSSSLSSLRMMLESFTEKAPDLPETLTFCTQGKLVIDAVIRNVRNISHNLSPLGKGIYGFVDSLEDLKDMVNQSGKIKMALDIEPADLSKLNDTTTLALYRVFTELINNTIKHAQASHIVLSVVESHGKLRFDYRDDGIGIRKDLPTTRSGIGMKNIESRLRMIGAGFNMKEPGTGAFEMSILLTYQHI